MSVSQFRAIPKNNKYTIPFTMDEKSLLEWLRGLSAHGEKEACLSILRAMQALNKIEMNANNRMNFLNSITDYLKEYLNTLEGGGWDTSFPLSMDERVYAEAVTWNYLTLGESFFIAAKDATKKKEKALAAYMSLQAMGQAQLHMAAVYATPYDGFWTLVYKNYYWAEKEKLLDVAVKEFKGNTLNNFFKKILSFQACDTNQFRPRDMLTIFEFLDRVCADLPIYHNPDEEDGLFLFDIDIDKAPVNITKDHSQKRHASTRYFSPVVVAHNIFRLLQKGGVWNGALKSINQALFKRVIKTLGLAQKRRFTRLSEGYDVEGLVGFKNIIDFLRQDITEPLDLKPSEKQHFHKKRELTGANLSILDDTVTDSMSGEFDYDYHTTADNNIWENKATGSDVVPQEVWLKKVKIFDSSAKGYSVYWDDMDAKAKIGDVFGILSKDNKRLEVAIIRRIVMNTEGDFRFGAEVVGFESEAVFISYPNRKEEGSWGILIPGIKALKQADTLVYCMGSFRVGEKVYIYRKEHKFSLLIAKELHSTSGICHVELSLIDRSVSKKKA